MASDFAPEVAKNFVRNKACEPEPAISLAMQPVILEIEPGN